MQVQKGKNRVLVRLSIEEQEIVRKVLHCEYEPIQSRGAMLLGVAPNLYEVVEAPYSEIEDYAEPRYKCMSLVLRLRQILPSEDVLAPIEVVRSWVDPEIAHMADKHRASIQAKRANPSALAALQRRVNNRYHVS